jgi:RNA polymerase sigma-70 factor, ECF subfamily
MEPTTQSLHLVELLRSVAAGSRESFSQLYRASGAKLFAVISRIVRDEPVAEEVLQDVFVSIWAHAPDYDPDKSQPMTWMITIARNRALDWVRRGRLDETPLDESFDDWVSDERLGDNSPLAVTIERSEASIVRSCVDRLQADYRQSISLAFYQGLTHSEIAEHLKIPLGTVKSHVRRGLQKLKTCLGL